MSTRARSIWGWGWADRFPDDEARLQLGQMVAAMTGFQPAGMLRPPSVDQIRVAPSRRAAPEALASMFSSEPEVRARHSYGKAYPDLIRAFVGDFSGAPDLVAYPSSEAELTAVLAWCSDKRIAVVPYGGGTSVVGGVEGPREGFDAWISLDLARLDQVAEIDPVSRLARIGAGRLGPDIEAALGREGLTLRHFPQSFEHSTLGGWIATRAGGHFATLYTHIDDLVASCRMITPAGLWASPTFPESGAGPKPDRLVLGSEGTLGVISEAVVRVRKKPSFRAGASVRFARFADAVKAVRAIAQSGLYPANCRLLDEREAALFGVSSDKHSVLILGFESDDHPLDGALARALEHCRAHGGVGEPKSEGAGGAELWKQAFLDAPYLQSTLVSLGLLADTFETACTWKNFWPLHEAVVKAVRGTLKELCGGGMISCRFTHVYPDGPAPYYTYLAPVRPGAELETWTAVKAVAADTLLAHGGTITHHHAVGRTHKPWYQREVPAPFLLALGAAKRALDPAGILNPGVLL